VFIRELSYAAAALKDRELARELLDDLAPIASTCGVNGAVVAFAGSHAEPASWLAESLGLPAEELAREAADAYRRLGASGWQSSVPVAGRGVVPVRSMTRRGRFWDVVFHDERATVAHTKGVADIVVLMSRPDKDVSALDLYGSGDRSSSAGDVVDRDALMAYRRRVNDLDDEIAEAAAHNDIVRRARLEEERDAVIDELRRVTTHQAGPRTFANYPAERARKAVAARVRDAIRRLADDAPALASHLDGAVVTGMQCRYRGDGGPEWQITDVGEAP
jgi:hypothetical protein